MKISTTIVISLLSLGASVVNAASWTFSDATLSIAGKGAGVGGNKEKLTPNSQLTKGTFFGPADNLKIILTTIEDDSPKRPNQAFLKLREPTTGLEESFPFSVKESGKAKVEVTHKDLPIQLLTSSSPLEAELIIASFGSSTPYHSKVFDLTISRDASAPLATPEPPLRYGKLEEIHHIFRADPRSPPMIVSALFTVLVFVAFPVLCIAWAMNGANIEHLQKAMDKAPLSHALFFGSIVAMEGIFFLYYTVWNLFQTLPAAAVVGIVCFLSGSRALSEVQERRLAGLR